MVQTSSSSNVNCLHVQSQIFIILARYSFIMKSFSSYLYPWLLTIQLWSLTFDILSFTIYLWTPTLLSDLTILHQFKILTSNIWPLNPEFWHFPLFFDFRLVTADFWPLTSFLWRQYLTLTFDFNIWRSPFTSDHSNLMTDWLLNSEL